MVEARFSAHDVNTDRAAVEGAARIEGHGEILWGLSRREFGPMSMRGRPPWDVASNRMEFLKLHGLSIENLIAPALEHTAEVAVVTRAERTRGSRDISDALPATDGLLTREANLILMTTHADCLPLWLATDSGWIGMLHAGWRGIVAGIVPAAIAKIPEAERAGLVVAAGPAICAEHYEVGEEVAEQFRADESLAAAVIEGDGKPHLDLAAAVRAQVEGAGGHYDDSMNLCTYEERTMSSFRRDGEPLVPMAAFIVRREG